jgi:membrane protein DedA with SNARE-associated domain
MSRMSYPRFLIANVIGGVGWAVLVGVVGYLAGDSYKKVESALGSVSYVLLGLIAAGLIGWHFWRRRCGKP